MEEVRLGEKRGSRPKVKLLISGFKLRSVYLQHSCSFLFLKLLWVQKKSVRTRPEEEKEVQGREEKKTGRKERMEGLLQLPQVHPVGSSPPETTYPTLCSLVPEEQ